MITLNAIIIDDEPLAIKVLKNYIEQIKEVELTATFSNAVEASTFLQQHTVDIVFLDINMPVLNGLDFLANLAVKPMVIMTTAHEEYALKSFDLEAIDYLVKPIPFPRFLKAVQRIIGLKQGQNTVVQENNAAPTSSIFVKVDKKKLQKINIDDIVVIESLKDYIHIKTTSQKFIVHRTLSSFTEELPSDKFIRIHRSYTVAIERITAVEGNSLEIEGIRYTIGRSYLNEVKSKVLDGYNNL